MFDLMGLLNFVSPGAAATCGAAPDGCDASADSLQAAIDALVTWHSAPVSGRDAFSALSAWRASIQRSAALAQNEIIYAQLNALDMKSIRALREGDSARVDQIEAQAASLRAALVK
jgi:hypothetical protein